MMMTIDSVDVVDVTAAPAAVDTSAPPNTHLTLTIR